MNYARAVVDLNVRITHDQYACFGCGSDCAVFRISEERQITIASALKIGDAAYAQGAVANETRAQMLRQRFNR